MLGIIIIMILDLAMLGILDLVSRRCHLVFSFIRVSWIELFMAILIFQVQPDRVR